MQLINLTPHKVVICEDIGNHTVEPSGKVARVTIRRTKFSNVWVGSPHEDEFPVSVYKTEAGTVEGLPASNAGTFYIVSSMVRLALPDRKDLLSLGELVRNAEGQPIGCRGLDMN